MSQWKAAASLSNREAREKWRRSLDVSIIVAEKSNDIQ